MNITGSGRMIASATRDLSVRWGETKESWRDSKGREFEANYLASLFGSMERMMAGFDQLDKVVSKIRSDCE